MDDLREQVQAAVAGTYRIERELGGGGMSRVFLAEEIAFGRQVVLKLLQPDMAGFSSERFAREITVAARLQQANIVPLFAAGTAAGLPYYVMPFVRGESLRHRLAGGALPASEVVPILRDVARALAYAHAEGFIHRDIKPENVLLSGGAAVVTDFGIAKAISEARAITGDGSASLTATGTSLGTPAYMAPEQVAADPSLDHRADLYAFGAMAYELLSGAPPFAHRTSYQGMIAAHLTEQPKPLEERVPSCPPALAALVMQCLEKDRARRPQTATAIVAALDNVVLTPSARPTPRPARRPATMAAAVAGVLALVAAAVWVRARDSSAATRAVVAVMPFTTTTGDTTLGDLAGGLTTDVRGMLRHVPGVSAVSEGASTRFAASRDDRRTIGQKLGAHSIVEGAISPSPQGATLALTLTDATSDGPPRRVSFSGSFAQLLGWRDSIVALVTAPLRATPPADLARWALRTKDPGSYLAYMQQMREKRRLRAGIDPSPWRAKIVRWDSLLAVDPGFIDAYVAEANELIGLRDTFGSTLPDSERKELGVRAKDRLRRAQAIDRANPGAELVLSDYLLDAGDTVAARAALLRALDADPDRADAELSICALDLAAAPRVKIPPASCARAAAMDSLNPDVWHQLGHIYFRPGQDPMLPRAAAAFLRASSLDPLAAEYHGDAGHTLYHAFLPESGLAEVRRALALDQQSTGYYSTLAEILSGTDRLDEGVEAAKEAVRTSNSSAFAIKYLGNLLLAARRSAEAEQLERDELRRHPQNADATTVLASALWDQEKFDDALRTMRAAVALDSLTPSRWTAYGGMLRLAGKGDEAMRALDRARLLAPKAPATLRQVASLYEGLGRPLDAVAAFRQLTAADSSDAGSWGNLSYAEVLAGRPDSALAAGARALAIDSTLAYVYTNTAMAWYLKGDPRRAVREIEQTTRYAPYGTSNLAQRIWFRARAGRSAEARPLLDTLVARAKKSPASSLDLAVAYAGLGDTATATKMLAAAAEKRDRRFGSLTLDDPLFAPLRATPEYARARSRLGMVSVMAASR